MPRIIIEFDVYPTENEQKIISSIKKFFDVNFNFSGEDVKHYIAETKDERIIELIEEEIRNRNLNRDAIVKKKDDHYEVLINKQAICVKKLRFLDEEQTLGAIRIRFYPK
ncbi:MAG: hypothetical protein OH319_00435 [Candidatus Parvarchaeota archaeon]|nr:hypothetical protein [Candidatus Jingweiarchaeum tengchongense]MCW1298390.1 hypothetical protein [Candidatus Jingweiarchaeum tengchongense]MCW1300308.1 hypothetical protein [Candidatus Jingweiarchaeum tengchongense]MCW1304896.1 hypothetical protein [Candidatus Jingweiarchaeum tengchongense]MCW1305804.1 hypothetical protein [Candidatus Jingweiarchaeum tengchongense]